MNKIIDLEKIAEGTDIMGGIDITGTFAKVFKTASQMPGCLFLLCTQGDCSITVHLDKYQLSKNSLVVIFPGLFFHITEKSSDCRFVFLAFSSDLIHSSRLFSYSIEFTPYIFERPVLNLSSKAGKLVEDYFMLFVRAKQLSPRLFDREQATMAYAQLIMGVGGLFRHRPVEKHKRNRDQAIIKSVIRLVIDQYKYERNISYYADKIHLSAQYLSATIKKMTGSTLTDIISNLVIHDAKAKLLSTELSIQEISDSLNFSDISSFGKYFKRYVGMTPSQYRNSQL